MIIKFNIYSIPVNQFMNPQIQDVHCKKICLLNINTTIDNQIAPKFYCKFNMPQRMIWLNLFFTNYTQKTSSNFDNIIFIPYLMINKI